MSHTVILNFTQIRDHYISLKKPSHVTHGVLEFYLNSGALHLSKGPSNVTYGDLEFYLNSGALHLSKGPSHITYGVLEFCLIQEHCISLKEPSHVTYGAFESYLNSGALHLFNENVTCHKWCS